MKLAVLGGRLQGVEIAYLARKAGWQVVGVDRDATAPAAGLCDAFYAFDLMDGEQLTMLLQTVDFVIPALEDQEVLDHINRCAAQAGVRMAYDREAYLLSSSKIHSDGLFAMLGVPAPKPWPFCGFPLTVKPSSASGSKGVRLCENARQFERWQATVEHPETWVQQEFLSGPSYSIEVIGSEGGYRTFQITELEMDAVYDCKRVTAPVSLPEELETAFRNIALTLAKAVQLRGIMDVEVILHQGQLKVLEIDARFPSQTPTVVYQSSGINLVQALWQSGKKFECPNPAANPGQGVIYEHIRVAGQSLSICGEHIMAEAGPLSLHRNFFGAQEALTNYRPGQPCWVATLIILGENPQAAQLQRDEVLATIRQELGITDYLDPVPPSRAEQRQACLIAEGVD